jgi:hypothetical protein
VTSDGKGIKMQFQKVVSYIAIVLGAVFMVSGTVSYAMVSSTLAEERITVAGDAELVAGKLVNGPISAYSQAAVIQKHSLSSTNGMTYAELDREDPLRAVAMNGSFLRASLFTSVVSFGLSAFVVGVGLLFVLMGSSMLGMAKKLS